MTAGRARSDETAAIVTLVEDVLRRIGGGVRVSEPVHHTGLSELDVTDALHELEHESRGQPFAWTIAAKTPGRSR